MFLQVDCILDALRTKQFPEKDCVLRLLSQCIGYGIIAASTVVKVPQILRMLRNKSAEGLSQMLFEAEVVGYTIVLGYCLQKGLPFSAYGEVTFLLLQSIIQLGLLYHFNKLIGPTTWLKVGAYSAVAPAVLVGRLTPEMYEILFGSMHFIFTGARLPQMYSNWKAKSTGELSLITSFANTAGGMARIFTGLQVKAPISMVLGTVVGAISNGILLLQIIMYAPKKNKDVKGSKSSTISKAQKKER